MAVSADALDTAARLMPGVKANESGSLPDDQVPPGDGGKSRGAYQVSAGALEDVNKAFGTSYSPADLDKPAVNKEVAQKYLTLQVQRFGPRVGLEAYNAGPTRVAAGDVPQASVDYAARALNVGGMGNSIAGDFGTFQQMLGTPDSSWMAPTMTALRANQTAERAELGGINRETEADYQADRARARTAYDAASKDDTTPWNKPPPPREALEGFASAGSIFAAIASAFTRTPAVSAMNGMAAAINARRDGNQQAYDQAYKVWQDNTKLAIDRQKMASDRLSQAMQMMTTDVAHGTALARQVMVEHGDERGLLMLDAGMHKELADSYAARDRTAAQLAIQTQRLIHPTAKPQILTDPGTKDEQGNPIQYIWNAGVTGPYQFTTLAGDPFVPKGAAKMASGPTGGSNPLTPDAADMQARFYLKTGTIPAGFGGQGMRTQIIERAKDIAKSEGKSVDDYIEGRATLRADTASLGAVTKQMNAAEGYERGAVKALDLAVHMIPPTAEPLDMQTLTRWVRTGETEFGDVKVPAYMAQMIVSLDQYAKVLTGATGAQGSTDSARNLALSLIPPGATSQQIPEIANTLKKDMALKIQGYTEQINNIRQGIAAPTGPGPVTPTPGASELGPKSGSAAGGTPPAGHPEARWSAKYNSWLIPGASPNEWVPVQ